MGIPGEEGGGERWSVDHLFLDQDAIPTLVEVKRSSDTRIRREVVGQMLDYAANAVVYWPAESIRAMPNGNSPEGQRQPAEQARETAQDDCQDSAEGHIWSVLKTRHGTGPPAGDRPPPRSTA